MAHLPVIFSKNISLHVKDVLHMFMSTREILFILNTARATQARGESGALTRGHTCLPDLTFQD